MAVEEMLIMMMVISSTIQNLQSGKVGRPCLENVGHGLAPKFKIFPMAECRDELELTCILSRVGLDLLFVNEVPRYCLRQFCQISACPSRIGQACATRHNCADEK